MSENTEKAVMLKENDFAKMLKKKNVKANDVTCFLKNNIVDLDVVLPSGYNCLHHAIKTENPDIVDLLFTDFETGTQPANPNTHTKDDKKDIYLSPLQYCLQEVCDYSACTKILKILIKHNADIKETDNEQKNLLHLLADKGYIEMINYVLEKEPSLLNSVCKYGSILHIAVSNDNTDLIEELLSVTDIDLKLLDYQKNTALLLSVVVKNFNCFKLIFDHIKDNSAISSENKKILFNMKNEEDNGLLHELAYAKSTVLINMVLKLDSAYGVDPEERNKNAHTYKDIQNNIVKMVKEREEQEKKRKEEIREHKKKLLEEEKKLDEEIRLRKQKQQEDEERAAEFREKILNHKGKIFAFIMIAFMIVLYYSIQMKIEKKSQPFII